MLELVIKQKYKGTIKKCKNKDSIKRLKINYED